MSDFPRNRYDAGEFVRLFDAASVTSDCGDVCVGFNPSHELTDEFTIYFPSCDDNPSSELLALARSLCSSITRLDNLVQESCESEYNRQGRDPKDYAIYLAFADIENGKARLEYYGTHVNTQWSARFEVQSDGTWEKTNF